MGHWILSSHVSLKASIRVSVAASNVPDMEETIFQTTKQIFSIYDIYIYDTYDTMELYILWNKPYVKQTICSSTPKNKNQKQYHPISAMGFRFLVMKGAYFW
jgi:hypothetical protein